jgi:23S rRNA (guanosine2251-2'-O)-methyltransferase
MKNNGMIIYGRNPVRSALGAGHVKTLYVAQHLSHDPMLDLAKRSSVIVRVVDERQLDQLSEHGVHQGFAALVSSYSSWTLETVLAQAKKPYPLILVLDGIEDPHNLGAILRSADAFGVDGVILKSHDGVLLNPTVAKVSTGAIDYVKVAVVTNLSQAIETMKEQGYWVVASDGSATQSYSQIDYASPIALIIGSEGFGISPLLLKRSDFVVKIPMFGHVNSLNASVATGILLSEIARSRQK